MNQLIIDEISKGAELLEDFLLRNGDTKRLSKEGTIAVMRYLHKTGKAPKLKKDVIAHVKNEGYRWVERFGDADEIVYSYPFGHLYFDCLARFHEIKKPEMKEEYRTTIDIEISNESRHKFM